MANASSTASTCPRYHAHEGRLSKTKSSGYPAVRHKARAALSRSASVIGMIHPPNVGCYHYLHLMQERWIGREYCSDYLMGCWNVPETNIVSSHRVTPPPWREEDLTILATWARHFSPRGGGLLAPKLGSLLTPPILRTSKTARFGSGGFFPLSVSPNCEALSHRIITSRSDTRGGGRR